MQSRIHPPAHGEGRSPGVPALRLPAQRRPSAPPAPHLPAPSAGELSAHARALARHQPRVAYRTVEPELLEVVTIKGVDDLARTVEISAVTPGSVQLLHRALDALSLPIRASARPPAGAPGGFAAPVTLAVPRFRCAPLSVSGAQLAKDLDEVDGALRACRVALGDVSTTPYGRAYLAHEHLLCDLAARERDQVVASGPYAVGVALAAVTELAGHAAATHAGSYHEDDLMALRQRTLGWAREVTGARSVSPELAAHAHLVALGVVVAGEPALGLVA